MNPVAPAVFYALFIWWFSTGLVLLLVLRRNLVKVSLLGAAIVYPLSLAALVWAGGRPIDIAGAYVGFTAAILLWGTVEVSFLTGAVTGPRPLPCPSDAKGITRLGFAVRAIIWHELALAATGLAVLVMTWRQPDQVGPLTFLVLWVMRLSAKVNLFLGVPVLNDEAMPQAIAHLRSYFRRGRAGAFFPLSLLGAFVAAAFLIVWTLDATASRAAVVGDVLVATLLFLAIVEHVFMVVPLPIGRLWQWSMDAAGWARTRPATARREERSLPIDRPMERVAPTHP